MNKKKWIVIVGAVIVIAVILAVIAYWPHGNVAKAPTLSGTGSSGTANVAAPTGTAGNVSSSTAIKIASSSNSGPSISVTRRYVGGSFEFSYPVSWTVFTTPPFTVTNFGGQFTSANLVPMGGLEIQVVTTTVYNSNPAGIMKAELTGATNLATSTVTVDNISCSSNSFAAPNIQGESTAVYCERGTELWKIYLTYRTGDPSASADVAAFNSMLSSMKFLP